MLMSKSKSERLIKIRECHRNHIKDGVVLIEYEPTADIFWTYLQIKIYNAFNLLTS